MMSGSQVWPLQRASRLQPDSLALPPHLTSLSLVLLSCRSWLQSVKVGAWSVSTTAGVGFLDDHWATTLNVLRLVAASVAHVGHGSGAEGVRGVNAAAPKVVRTKLVPTVLIHIVSFVVAVRADVLVWHVASDSYTSGRPNKRRELPTRRGACEIAISTKCNGQNPDNMSTKSAPRHGVG